MRRGTGNGLALFKIISPDAKRRVSALFLFVVFLTSIITPTASAVGLAQQPDDQIKIFDYPAGMQRVEATAKAAADALPAASGNPLSTIKNGDVPTGEILQGLTQAPKITPHELTGKRTATSSVSVNVDGSLTEKHFMAPKHFQKEGRWEAINTTLVEDKNAGDSGNIFGQALGEVQSWLSSTTNFTVEDNDWQARFSPSDSDKGMVRIRKGSEQVGFVPVNAKQVAPVITTNSSGKQTVHYYDLWPGINVEYTVESAALKENIVIKDKNAANKVSFKLLGAGLEKRTEKYTVGNEELSVEAYVLKGVFNDEFAIAPPNLMLNNFGMVTESGVFGQTYENGIITISVDGSYLQNLPENAFPAVIDPTTNVNFGTRYGGGNYMSFKSDGYVCPWNICNLYAGSLYDSSNTLRWWRGAFHVPYDQFRNGTGNYLTNATLHLQQRSDESFWTGGWGTHNYQVGWATCLNGFNCVDGIWHSGNVGGSGDINVTNLYQAMINAGDFGGWLMVMGEDGTTNSYKNFDPGVNGNGTDGTYVSFTYGGPPPAPSIGVPVANQVYVDPQPSFRVSAVGNPNGSTPLQYEFVVSGAPAASGGLIASGRLNATQWTIPDGILQDGSTYYVQARTYDLITNSYSGWGTPVPFRIDMRTGKDASQTYDSLGPVNVDLATGNVTTGATSHTSAALGGSLGISLDYNSPLKSRNGLVGEYWNNTSLSGSPLVTRMDQNVQFNWQGGSPSAGTIPDDYFSARWTGWFVAPADGSYYFGADKDDNFKVWINGQQVYDGTCCGLTYGTPVNLTAGQVAQIKLEYSEIGGDARASLYVKGAVAEQVVPSEWLRTDVRPVTGQKGLTGSYFGKFDGTNTFSANNALLMQRTDPFLNFNWGEGSPMPGGPDGFLVRWTGYITVPTSGNYVFGVKSDDGAKIMLGTNDTVVYNEWVNRSATESYGSAYAMTANTPTKITIEYYDQGGVASFEFKVQGAVPQQLVPPSWLSPNAQVLPDGWNMGIDADGNVNYDHLKVNQNSVVLTDSTGSTHEYAYKDGGYKPPVNEDGQLIRNADGTYTLQDADGRTYVFNADGTLQSLTSPIDDRKPAALQYEYEGTPARLKQITDGVDSNRWAKVYYYGSSECGSIPGGFDTNTALLSGLLCAVKTNDGRATYFYYIERQLARIAQPGNQLTDYQYEAVQNAGVTIGYRLVSIRDSLANDAIAASIRTDDATVKTQITYDNLGRAVSVTQPAATAGATRIQHTIEYLPGIKSYVDQNGNTVPGYEGKTNQHVAGATEPNGFSRQVKYDNLFRTIESTDIANLSAKVEWDAQKDLVLSTTDPTGLKSTTLYDDADRPVESFGPAPTAWFGSDRRPTSTYLSQTPHAETNYDEGLVGPAVAWYNVKGSSLFGAPKLHTTGLDPAHPSWVWKDFVSSPAPITADAGMDGIGFSATGKVRFPQAATYTIRLWHDDGARLWIDDKLITDDWAYRSEGATLSSPSTTFPAEAGKLYRFRLDYVHFGNPGGISLCIIGSGISDQSCGSGLGSRDWTFLSPGYNLTTSTKTYDSTIGDVASTINYGANPELSLPQSTTVDPTGLNLTSTSAYEVQGATNSFLRQTNKTLPGGNTTSYDYYTAVDTRDNPCTVGTTEAYKQAGFMRRKTEPNPDGSTGGGGSGALVVRSSSSGSISTGALTLAKPSGTVDGDLLVMTASADLSDAETLTYTVAAGWTQLLANTRSDATSAGNNLQVWYKIANSEPANYTITPDHSNLIAGSILRIDGHNTISPIDVSNVTASLTGEASAPAVTTTVNNDLVLRLVTWDQSKTINAIPSGHTQSYYVDVSGHDNWGGYKEQASAGSTGLAQFDLSGGAPYVGFTVAIKPQGSGGGSSATGRTAETIYDDTGRVVASRINNDDWTCTTYDSRGRVTQTVVPTVNGRAGRTVTTSYNYQGSPFKVQVVDSVAGTTVSEIDLLGRTVSATDQFGNVSTAAYDNLGRLTSKTTPVGTESYTYDTYSRVTEYLLGGTKYATITYDAFSRVQDITYNQANDASPPSGIAPTVQSSTSGSTSSGALTLNKPTGTANGDLLVMTASADLSASEDVTYTVPSGWAQLLANTRSDATSAGNNLQVWYKVANSEPANYAITPDHDNLIGGSIMRITGHDATTPVDVSNVTASATGEAAAPSVTTTVNNAQVLRFATWDQSKTLVAAPSGVTQSYYVDVSGHDNWGGYKEQAAAGGTGVAQFDLSSGAPYVGFTVAIKPAGSSGNPSANTLKLEQIKRDTLQRNAGAVFRFSNGTTFDETVTRTQSGMVNSYTDVFGGSTAGGAYTYDKAGRLTGATVDGNTYSYGYNAPSGSTCNQSGANLNSHKNSNRTSFTANGNTTTYCYDHADRLISSTDTQLGTPTYDDHGNTVSLAGNGTPIQFTYDASDSNTEIEQGATKVMYVKTASGNVLRKKEYTNGTLTKSYRYLAGGAVLQTCNLTNDNDCTTIDTYLSLPGGVTLTMSPTNPDTTKRTIYTLKNFHGDTAITAGSTGLPTSSIYLYEPFGQPTTSTTFGTNSNPTNSSDSAMTWAANPTRKVAGAFSLAIVQLGARVYLPGAGRFLQVDPIEGGVHNAYVYIADPINANDYSGLLAVISSRSNARIVGVIYNYGMQPAPAVPRPVAPQRVQTTAPAARTQGPGAARSSSGRTAAPVPSSPSTLSRIGSGVTGGAKAVGGGVGSAASWMGNGIVGGAQKLRENETHIEAGIIGCIAGASGVVGMSLAATLATGGAAAPPAAGTVALSCLTGGSAAVLNSVAPGSGAGLDAHNQYSEAWDFYMYFRR